MEKYSPVVLPEDNQFQCIQTWSYTVLFQLHRQLRAMSLTFSGPIWSGTKHDNICMQRYTGSRQIWLRLHEPNCPVWWTEWCLCICLWMEGEVLWNHGVQVALFVQITWTACVTLCGKLPYRHVTQTYLRTLHAPDETNLRSI